MSVRFKTIALACAATLISAPAFAQVGGGTELPSNAKAAKANGGAMPKKSMRPMTGHKMMKKSKGKMSGHKTF